MNIIITVAMIAKVIIIMMMIVNNQLCFLFKNLIPRCYNFNMLSMIDFAF